VNVRGVLCYVKAAVTSDMGIPPGALVVTSHCSACYSTQVSYSAYHVILYHIVCHIISYIPYHIKTLAKAILICLTKSP